MSDYLHCSDCRFFSNCPVSPNPDPAGDACDHFRVSLTRQFKRPNGFYRVQPNDPVSDDPPWQIAEYDNGKWYVTGANEPCPEEDFIDIDEQRINPRPRAEWGRAMNEKVVSVPVSEVNRSPLGELAKKCLEELQVEEVDEYVLYPLQLVQAVIDENQDSLPQEVRENRDFLQDQTAIMTNWDPTTVLNLLLQPERDESLSQAADKYANQLKNKDPRQVGSVLSENLVWSLAGRRPWLLGPTTE